MTRLSRAFFPVYLAYTAFTVWCLVTYSGPVSYLNNLQLERFGSYSPLVTMLVLHVPILASLYLAASKTRNSAATPDSLPEATPDSLPAWPWFAISILCAGLGLGGWLLWKGFAAGTLIPIDAASLKASPPSRAAMYADLTGFASRNAVSMGSGSAPVMYIPVYEHRGADEAIAVIQVQDSEVNDRLRSVTGGKTKVRGVLESGPPGDVRYQLKKAGVRLPENSWVLHTRRDPSKDKKFGVGFMLVGLAASAVAYWRWRKDLNRIRVFFYEDDEGIVHSIKL